MPQLELHQRMYNSFPIRMICRVLILCAIPNMTYHTEISFLRAWSVSARKQPELNTIAYTFASYVRFSVSSALLLFVLLLGQ